MNYIESIFNDALNLHELIATDYSFQNDVLSAAQKIVSAIKAGYKLIVAGNGGSAADAQHFVAEIVGRFQKERRGLPAIALSTNTSSITALANDYSYDEIFSRQLIAIGRAGDIFFGITTSGKSPNIVKALETSRKQGITTIALLGKGGGDCAAMCDFPIIVPHEVTARIQEVHILVIHTICGIIDDAF